MYTHMRLIRHAVNGFELSEILAIGRRTVAVAVPLLLENINRCRRVCSEPLIQCALAVWSSEIVSRRKYNILFGVCPSCVDFNCITAAIRRDQSYLRQIVSEPSTLRFALFAVKHKF